MKVNANESDEFTALGSKLEKLKLYAIPFNFHIKTF